MNEALQASGMALSAPSVAKVRLAAEVMELGHSDAATDAWLR
jgi:hypothetical protein